MSITPNAEQFAEYAQSDLEGEVVMLNLLKFDKTGATNDETGQDAYGRYGAAVVKMIEARGGTIIWGGRPRHVFIGDVDANDWDAAMLVMYPSRQAFIEMVSSPEYAEAHTHREGGLADTVVIACAPMPGFETVEV